jgi:hypothetical protein
MAMVLNAASGGGALMPVGLMPPNANTLLRY